MSSAPQSTRQCSSLAQTSPEPQPPKSIPNPHADRAMSVWKEFVEPNNQYAAEFGKKGELPLPPGKKLAIITCMDARIKYVAPYADAPVPTHIPV